MLESAYQLEVIKRLKAEFPGCVVIINDPRRTQGIPDLLILFGPNWAMLEVKAVALCRRLRTYVLLRIHFS
jgi:hypothetical protein